MPEFAGFAYSDSGAAVVGATVNLYDRNTTAPVRTNTTTDANGYYAISHATEGRFDVELVNGASKRRVKYDDSRQYKELEASTFKIRNPANTFSYTIVPAAIVAARNLTLPLITGTDTVAALGMTQTFTGVNTFLNTGLVIRNPANTFSYTIVTGAITADRTLNIPLITATDTIMTAGVAQTSALAKTFNSQALLIRNPADTFSYTIVAAAIAANRSLTLPLITGTDTLAALGMSQTFTGVNVFLNTGLTILNPAGTFSYAIVSAAIAANRSLTLPLITGTDTLAALGMTQTFTGVNTFLNTGLTILNPATTFSYTIVSAAIAANRNLTLPLITATDTLATLGLAQTFTAAQTFSASMLLLRNPADTFSYTIVPAAIAAARNLNLPLITATDTLVSLGLAQTFSAAKTFNASMLLLRNPADTFSYTIVPAAIAAARNLNLPLITGTDTVAVLGLAQTFTATQTFDSPVINTALTGTAVGTGANQVAAGDHGHGAGGAPTDASYLVGAAHASLSAEIVVGATPGGELGGTWGSPTVDATHSGSAHSAYAALAGTNDFLGVNTFLNTGLVIDNPAGTFSYTIVSAAIAANRSLTLPLITATDTLVTLGLAQTFTAVKTFGSGDVEIQNPGGTFVYSFLGSAITGNRNATLPLLSTDDTFVMLAVTQTMTNKTLTSPVVNTQLTGTAVGTGASQVAAGNHGHTDITTSTETWTPVLAFGGASVGIAYSTQVGRYIKIGDLVHFHVAIVLTNNGSSTGSATITGLPFTNVNQNAAVNFWGDNLTYSGMLVARVTFSATNIGLYETTELGGLNALTEADIPDNAIIYISGMYFEA